MARSPSKTDEITEKLEAEAATLETQVAELRTELTRIAEILTGLASDRGHAFADAVSTEAGKLRAKGEAAAAAAKARADQQAEDARAYVRENPFTALGFAAVAGLLFGLIFGRR